MKTFIHIFVKFHDSIHSYFFGKSITTCIHFLVISITTFIHIVIVNSMIAFIQILKIPWQHSFKFFWKFLDNMNSFLGNSMTKFIQFFLGNSMSYRIPFIFCYFNPWQYSFFKIHSYFFLFFFVKKGWLLFLRNNWRLILSRGRWIFYLFFR